MLEEAVEKEVTSTMRSPLSAGDTGAWPDIIFRSAPVHFQVAIRCERLVTQMFVEGEQLNASDPALMRTRRPEAIAVRLAVRALGKKPLILPSPFSASSP